MERFFEKIPIIGFRRTKSLKKKDILARVKAAPLERRKAVADHAEVLGAKYANMLWQLQYPKRENIALSPIT